MGNMDIKPAAKIDPFKDGVSLIGSIFAADFLSIFSIFKRQLSNSLSVHILFNSSDADESIPSPSQD